MAIGGRIDGLVQRNEDPDQAGDVQTVVRGGDGGCADTKAEQGGREGAGGEGAETERGTTAVSAIAGLTCLTREQ